MSMTILIASFWLEYGIDGLRKGWSEQVMLGEIRVVNSQVMRQQATSNTRR